MADLRVIIDREKKRAIFSGPGTFHSKEEIKSLGAARWNSVEKHWEVSSFTLSVEELSIRFGELSIEESGQEVSATVEQAVEQTAALTVEAARAPGAAAIIETPEPLAAETSVRPTTTPSTLPKSSSVPQLIQRARGAIRSAFPGTVYVHGVLSTVKEMSNGRVFLDLVDKERPSDSISCVIWQGKASLLKPLTDAGFKLEEDLQVMFEVQVELNPRGSRLSLSIVGVVAEYTIAKLAALRDVTNERLKQEGHFEKNKSLALPFLPKTLGLLTSAGGTVINDFRASLDVSKFGFELFWKKVSVQGASAKQDIISGLELFGKRSDLDAILLFRGGGSASDLAVFNDYDVAKAVALCPLPVITAIGHQEDQSSVQDVSSIALGVPKDIGRFFADIVFARRSEVKRFVREISESSFHRVSFAQQRVKDLSTSLHALGVQMAKAREDTLLGYLRNLPEQSLSALGLARSRLRSTAPPIAALSSQICKFQEKRLEVFQRIVREASLLFEREQSRVDAIAQLVENASPDTQLKRGFALVSKNGGSEYVMRAADLSEGEEFELSFYDGNRRVLSKEAAN